MAEEEAEVVLASLAEVTAVQLPCFCASAAAALPLLGDPQRLRQRLDADKDLDLRFPEANPLRPTLTSKDTSRPALVARLTRRRDGTTRLTVIARVTRLLAFEEIADYQFLPASARLDFYATQAQRDNGAALVLETAPLSFGHCEARNTLLSFAYDTRGGRATGDASASSGSGEEEEEEEEDKRRSSAVVHFSAPAPLKHALGAHPPKWRPSHRGFALLHELKQLLEFLPVLSKAQMHQLLGRRPKHLFQESLGFAGFTYQGGPFHQLWLRYGYDASQYPLSVIFQQITCRHTRAFLKRLADKLDALLDRDAWEGKMLDLDLGALVPALDDFEHSFIAKGADARLPVRVFGRLLKQQVAYQVHMLHDDELLRLFASARRERVYDNMRGFLRAADLDQLRSAIETSIERRVAAFAAQATPQVPAPASLDEAQLRRLGDLLGTCASEDLLTYLLGADDASQTMLDWLLRYATAAVAPPSDEAVAAPAMDAPTGRRAAAVAAAERISAAARRVDAFPLLSSDSDSEDDDG